MVSFIKIWTLCLADLKNVGLVSTVIMCGEVLQFLFSKKLNQVESDGSLVELKGVYDYKYCMHLY